MNIPIVFYNKFTDEDLLGVIRNSTIYNILYYTIPLNGPLYPLNKIQSHYPHGTGKHNTSVPFSGEISRPPRAKKVSALQFKKTYIGNKFLVYNPAQKHNNIPNTTTVYFRPNCIIVSNLIILFYNKYIVRFLQSSVRRLRLRRIRASPGNSIIIIVLVSTNTKTQHDII